MIYPPAANGGILPGMGDAIAGKEFDCPKGGAGYRAFFRISTIAVRGSFNWRGSKFEVYAWGGRREGCFNRLQRRLEDET